MYPNNIIYAYKWRALSYSHELFNAFLGLWKNGMSEIWKFFKIWNPMKIENLARRPSRKTLDRLLRKQLTINNFANFYFIVICWLLAQSSNRIEEW